MSPERRYPIGAEPTSDGVHFRVWAPRRTRVSVVAEGRAVELRAENGGYFSAEVSGLRPGARYRFRLDDEGEFPDPASRFQPEGPHGPSEVIDPRFAWTDSAWRGPELDKQVLYELHVGLYTPEGTYRAMIGQLDHLKELGVTCLELMPVAEFPGTFGWGYDGVDLFAPTRLYGRPDDLRALVDAAHARGLAVILDVVYNHLGPDGNYLGLYANEYVSKKYKNEWGEALNFDGERSPSVRELFVSNARYWIDEFHFDGLRLDATQSIHDASEVHVIREVADAVRAAARGRSTLLVGENEPQHARMIHEYGLDMLWNDDFHHSARVAVTGHDEAYFTDYSGSPQELVSALKHGFLFQGQHYHWQKQRRGMPARGLARHQCVVYVQNHDQIANSAKGARLDRLTSPGRLRAITALTLLAPATPMLFMGQEFASSSPFLYFADHQAELARAVRTGRGEFLAQFPSIATDEMKAALDPPEAKATHEKCRLDLRERETHAESYALHKDLLQLRLQMSRDIDGAVLAGEAFCIRYFGDNEDHLLLVNLGPQLHLERLAEPLLAPLAPEPWSLVWSSESLKYGGDGTPAVERPDGRFDIPAHSAVVLTTSRMTKPRSPH